MFAASRYYQQPVSPKHAEFEPNDANKHYQRDPFRQIQDELTQCESLFTQNIEKIIRQWKASKMKQYKKIISTVDLSLRKNICPIICEQIGIQRQHLNEIVYEVESSLAKLKQQSTKDKVMHQNQDKTISVMKSKEKNCTSLKARSISNDSHPRRKLSKGAFFAQAKKVASGQPKGYDYMISTTPATGFYNKFQKAGSKVKKVKRKQQNCFDALDRYNNSSSPSNFMLSYLNNKQVLKNNDPNIINKVRQNNYIPHEKENNENRSTIKSKVPSISQAENTCTNQSQTYQKLMINFQQKISKKLDDLMVKYTKIQEKLENYQEEKTEKYTLKLPEKMEKQKQNTISIEQSLNQNSHENLTLPQATMISLNKAKDETLSQMNAKNNIKTVAFDEETKIKQDSIKKCIKSIEINNKVVKNKIKIIQNFSDSLQEISICKESPPKLTVNNQLVSKKDLEQQKKLQSQSQKMKIIQNDKKYFQDLILEFYSVCVKVKIAITKQLLYLIKEKYKKYCKINQIEENNQITNIKVTKIEDMNKQFFQILAKMEKSLVVKCQKEKKQLLRTFVETFIRAIFCYDDKNNLIQCNQSYTDNDLKAKIQQLRTQFCQNS